MCISLSYVVEYGIETIMVVVNLCVMFMIVTELFALDRHYVTFSCSLNVYWLCVIFNVFYTFLGYMCVEAHNF